MREDERFKRIKEGKMTRASVFYCLKKDVIENLKLPYLNSFLDFQVKSRQRQGNYFAHTSMDDLDPKIRLNYDEALKKVRLKTRLLPEESRNMLLAKDEYFDNVLIQNAQSARQTKDEIKKIDNHY